MLSPLRFATGLQSGYHLFFLSLFAGVVSMSLTAVGVDVLQGNELLFPGTIEKFFRIWVIDIALITLVFGTTYLVENHLISRENRTKRELKIADKLGEKIVCFLGEAMISKDYAQLSIGNGRTCVGIITKIPTPLPMWGVPNTQKEVSMFLVFSEFLDPVTGEVTRRGLGDGKKFISQEDYVELHIPLSQIEFAGWYRQELFHS